jgi:hypothetical protein
MGFRTIAILVESLLVAVLGPLNARGQSSKVIENAAGVRMLVFNQNSDPTLRIELPGYGAAEGAFQVIFPEHVTVRAQGKEESSHLYLWQPGRDGSAPAWKETGRALEYEMDLEGGIHMLARATLEDDGVRFHYEFNNRSDVNYDMVYAPTDPRLTGILHDVRLERTYVHGAGGFQLLGAGTPARLTMPLKEWLPLRYLASYAWPVPARLVEKRADGITYYNASQKVDEPMIATVSSDGKWVVASFTRTVGNVWSNPELTCQHVDPTPPLPANGTAVVEVKMLILRGGLQDALRKIEAQRDSLK